MTNKDLPEWLRFIADEYQAAWHGRDVAKAVADLRAAADHIERCENPDKPHSRFGGHSPRRPKR